MNKKINKNQYFVKIVEFPIGANCSNKTMKICTFFVKTHAFFLGIDISETMITGFFDVNFFVIDDETDEAFVGARIVSHGISVHEAVFFPLTKAQIGSF